VPVAQWYKVGVLASRVHSIVMSSNNMNGKLPASIAALSELRMIELATMAGLHGPLPTSLCTISSLRRLCICRCSLSGHIPHQIGDLLALEELQLFGNLLSGAIPATLGRLVNLRLLSLGEYTGGNGFTAAPLPDCIRHLHRLEALFMANCNLTGAVPSWLGGLLELRQVDMQRNMIVGNIPDAIGSCHSLLYLNLKDNEGLCGAIPVQALARLTKLNRLSLVHCNFTITTQALANLQTALPRCKIWV
jgi:Leucine-rich repeat (LRR) protein